MQPFTKYIKGETKAKANYFDIKGCRRSRSWRRNKKSTAIRSNENQTDEVGSRIPFLLWFLRIWSGESSYRERARNRPFGLFVFFYFRLRQSIFHWIIIDGVASGIRRKWKCSDSFDSNSVELMLSLWLRLRLRISIPTIPNLIQLRLRLRFRR